MLEVLNETLFGASDSEKEKDLDILGRGGKVKRLLIPLCYKEKDKNMSAIEGQAITRLVVLALKIFIFAALKYCWW